METEVNSTYTVQDHLAAQFKFAVPRAALYAKLIDRSLEPESEYDDAFRQDKEKMDKFRLAYADIIKWFVLGASKKNNTSESDNGWTHSGGGYEIDDTDRKLLMAEANSIYKELEPESIFKIKTTFRMKSLGVKPADYDMGGNPLPHIIR